MCYNSTRYLCLPCPHSTPRTSPATPCPRDATFPNAYAVYTISSPRAHFFPSRLPTSPLTRAALCGSRVLGREHCARARSGLLAPLRFTHVSHSCGRDTANSRALCGVGLAPVSIRHALFGLRPHGIYAATLCMGYATVRGAAYYSSTCILIHAIHHAV